MYYIIFTRTFGGNSHSCFRICFNAFENKYNESMKKNIPKINYRRGQTIVSGNVNRKLVTADTILYSFVKSSYYFKKISHMLEIFVKVLEAPQMA